MTYGSIPAVGVEAVPFPLPTDLHMLDVREDVEWQHGHVPDALHIPIMELPARLHEVPAGRAVVVCRVGGRSAYAVAYLRSQGHDAVNLEGGMLAWAAAGRAMSSETGGVPQVV
jgi:rhodanese-related sulfurtransferase